MATVDTPDEGFDAIMLYLQRWGEIAGLSVIGQMGDESLVEIGKLAQQGLERDHEWTEDEVRRELPRWIRLDNERPTPPEGQGLDDI